MRQLLGIAERCVSDASLAGISSDGRLNNADDVVRCVCEAALHAHGYRVPRDDKRKHQRVIDSLEYTIGGAFAL